MNIGGARKTEITAKQRWNWAYNKIIMQLNVSTPIFIIIIIHNPAWYTYMYEGQLIRSRMYSTKMIRNWAGKRAGNVRDLTHPYLVFCSNGSKQNTRLQREELVATRKSYKKYHFNTFHKLLLFPPSRAHHTNK